MLKFQGVCVGGSFFFWGGGGLTPDMPDILFCNH